MSKLPKHIRINMSNKSKYQDGPMTNKITIEEKKRPAMEISWNGKKLCHFLVGNKIFSVENGGETGLLDIQHNKIVSNYRPKVLFLSLVLSVVFMIISGCQGQPPLDPCFGFNAVAGIPSHEALQTDSYEDAAGRIRHKGSSIGQIRIFMPVFNTTGKLTDNVNWDRFSVLYMDPDDTGKAYRITATLQYLDESGSTPIVAELDSNMHSSTGISTMSTPFTHDFNFIARYYYVEIRVTRTKTDHGPWVGGFKICEQFQ